MPGDGLLRDSLTCVYHTTAAEPGLLARRVLDGEARVLWAQFEGVLQEVSATAQRNRLRNTHNSNSSQCMNEHQVTTSNLDQTGYSSRVERSVNSGKRRCLRSWVGILAGLCIDVERRNRH